MRFFYIIGNPRSGTSMFRLMLNAHPQVVSPPECGFIQWLYPAYSEADFSSSEVIESFAKDVLASKKMETWELNESGLLQSLKAVEAPSYSKMCEAVLLTYAKQRGKEDIQALVDKNNYYIQHLESLAKATPDAAYIHLVRDVRDVACSYLNLKKENFTEKYSPKLSDDIGEIAEEWRENNSNAANFLASKNHIVVKYEDLLLQPKDTLTEVLQFLGVEFHQQVLEFYNFNDEPAETMGWKKRTLSPPDPSRIGQFKELLSADAQAQIWELTSKTLEKYGYQQ